MINRGLSSNYQIVVKRYFLLLPEFLLHCISLHKWYSFSHLSKKGQFLCLSQDCGMHILYLHDEDIINTKD